MDGAGAATATAAKRKTGSSTLEESMSVNVKLSIEERVIESEHRAQEASS